MPETTRSAFLPFRQRAPFAGLFVAASLGILASDQQPEWWPAWSAAFLCAALFVWRIHSTFPAFFLTFFVFAFWHGNQVTADPGYRLSRKIPFDANEHTVTLVVLSEPKLDQLRSIQRFVAQVNCIDNRPVCFQVAGECSGEPFSYGDRIIAQGKFSVPTRPMNPGEFDFGAYLQRQNIYLKFRTHRDVPAMVTAQNQGNRLVAFALAARRLILQGLQAGLEDDTEVAQTIQGMILTVFRFTTTADSFRRGSHQGEHALFRSPLERHPMRIELSETDVIRFDLAWTRKRGRGEGSRHEQISIFSRALIPAAAMAQTTEERLSQLETRVKALEVLLSFANAQKAVSPAPAPSSPKDSPIELVDWDFDYEVGKYNQSQYKITYTLKNTSEKLIKLNRSELYFLDLLGETVTSVQIGADIQLPPGKPVIDTRYYDINQFISSQFRLRGMEKQNIKAVLVVAKAVFDDGSIYNAQSK